MRLLILMMVVSRMSVGNRREDRVLWSLGMKVKRRVGF